MVTKENSVITSFAQVANMALATTQSLQESLLIFLMEAGNVNTVVNVRNHKILSPTQHTRICTFHKSGIEHRVEWKDIVKKDMTFSATNIDTRSTVAAVSIIHTKRNTQKINVLYEFVRGRESSAQMPPTPVFLTCGYRKDADRHP